MYVCCNFVVASNCEIRSRRYARAVHFSRQCENTRVIYYRCDGNWIYSFIVIPVGIVEDERQHYRTCFCYTDGSTSWRYYNVRVSSIGIIVLFSKTIEKLIVFESAEIRETVDPFLIIRDGGMGFLRAFNDSVREMGYQFFRENVHKKSRFLISSQEAIVTPTRIER